MANTIVHNGTVRVPAPYNEPAKDYAPGSPEAVRLYAELDRVKGEVRELPHVIGGERQFDGEKVDLVAPHNHAHVLGRIPKADEKQVQAAIDAALAAQESWANTPWYERVAIFLRAADLVSGKYRDELLATTMLHQSKTYHQAEIDACELADFFRYNAHNAAQIYEQQPTSPAGQWNVMDHRGLEGFVLAITPFNFTAIAGNLPSTPAMMGNTVVWKPSEKSALSSDVVMRLFEEAGLPAGVINLVHGSGRAISEQAMAHEQFAGLNFTGSSAVFRGLWKTAGVNIEKYRAYPRLVGETGGKNAIVAHSSADPEALLVAMVRGAYEYQGQKCTAASRVYIPRSLWEAGLETKLVETVKGLKVGDITEHETYVGAVIDEVSADRLADALERAKALASHTLLAGGTVRKDKGWFVDPTLFVTTDPSAFTMKEEFFGPLLTVHVYDDAEVEWYDLLKLVDGTSEYALGGSIFARDHAAITEALSVLRNTAGMMYVNDKPTGALMGVQSFGGGRASGTNDKTGSPLALQRWVSGRYIKENMSPDLDWTYPYMGTSGN
ncbi:L-glutamate gamma-semialdehyde dehydrogenase [Streptomyces cavernicola]|uniref:L-glutamate gamma-semialdehyde dehydrogenase n=1 Tax=Streptomyces cavernicola TaxID=3043613 RepID=A0ABT6SF09_9ACTN|nr:L-glutamate gamma-semialdehyde dehydrogenase [Streptomyces sp. B-S-A6]MDI3406444.1 L-glutamate gamma-semialdehyde dehydrogenase [Streptomyces sp. B-S-A6]